MVRFIDGEPQSEPVVADADGSPNLYQLYRAYAAGWSVILASLSERWPPITSLCARLETALHHPMTACLYLTPPEAQGFPAHHDTADVFIVQVEGTKAWRCIRRAASFPRSMPRSTTSPLSADRFQDVRLDAGDVLYVPRGWIHEARTSAAPSLHVTLGVQVTRWSDLLIDVVTAVAEGDVRLREAAAGISPCRSRPARPPAWSTRRAGRGRRGSAGPRHRSLVRSGSSVAAHSTSAATSSRSMSCRH